MEFPHLERLSRAECRRLLPTAPVGRLAVPTPNFPTLDPVSFGVVEGELVVAVPPGSAGDALADGSAVSFEADVLNHAAHEGWSVVVTGPVEDLDDDVAALVAPLLGPWPVTAGDRLLLIRSERMTGQRIVAATGEPTGENADEVVLPPADNGDQVVLPTAAAPAAGAAGPAMTRRSISTPEALSLLATRGQHVGRLVLTLNGEPAVFPLNYAVDDDAIVFRTEVGTKLSGITRSMTTFEVDDIDGSGEGWAVAFEGLAQEVLEADPEGLRARVAALALDTWPGGERPHVVRITPYRVHGTMWTPAAVPTSARPDQRAN